MLDGKAVVLTDHPWADVGLERELVEQAGFALVTGGTQAGSTKAIETLVSANDPVAIMTCWAPVSAKAIAAPTRLAIVARVGVGLDNIAVPEATSRGAWVTNVPDYCVAEVADHAIALLLAAVRGTTALDRDVKAQGWHVPSFVPRRLSELTVGVIGYGRIGRETARKLQAFGCRILAVNLVSVSADPGVTMTTLAAVQAEADAIVLHVPLSADTAGMVDTAFLAACRRRPIIINVSRGGLIDNDALLAALDANMIAGAALDVIDGEPHPPRALMNRADVIVTPHIAYLSDASLIELRRRACEEVVRVLTGEAPHHPCNAPAHAS
jgi:D-3-phosphoglycerate dehydrogenase